MKTLKKKICAPLFLLAFTPFLVQCASQNDVRQLSYQLRVVNKKLEDMKVDTVGKMQKRQAASSSQMDQLQKEILVLKSQLDETGHLNRTLREQNKELESSINLYVEKSALEKKEVFKKFNDKERLKDEQIAALSSQLQKQQASVKALQTARVKDAERKAREAARAAEAANKKVQQASRANSSTQRNSVPLITATQKKVFPSIRRSSSYSSKPSKKVSQPSNKSTSKKQTSTLTKTTTKTSGNTFARGMSNFKNGDFKSAFKNFENYVENSPMGTNSIEARYMMGESLFWQMEYDQAILQYQKIISNHPRHSKASAALLRQGMAFEKLSDHETAKIIYKKIISSYGSSPEAITAKERSANI